MPQVHHPKLLLSLVLLAAAVGFVVVAVADEGAKDPDGGFVTQLAVVEPPTASAQDVALAETIARKSGLVEAAAGDVAWTLAVPRPRVATGTERGVQFRAILEEPVSPSMRWFSIACQGTQRHEYEAAYVNVHAFLFIVDLDEQQVITFGPTTLPPVSGDAHLASTPKLQGPAESLRFTVSDIASGTVLTTETALPSCPPGLSDD